MMSERGLDRCCHNDELVDETTGSCRVLIGCIAGFTGVMFWVRQGLVPEGVAWEDLVTPWLFVAYDDIQRYYFLLPTEIDTR